VAPSQLLLGHSGTRRKAAGSGIDDEQKRAVVEVRLAARAAPSIVRKIATNNRVSGTNTIRTTPEAKRV
jgi:hypothetical protein